MPETFLFPTQTTFIVNNGGFDLQVAYQTAKPNILLALIDSDGEAELTYRQEYIDINTDSDGNLIITSFADGESNSYSLDADGNLIYTF